MTNLFFSNSGGMKSKIEVLTSLVPGESSLLLGNEQRSFCRFRHCIQYCISDSFVDHDGYFISPEGFLPTVVDIMVI